LVLKLAMHTCSVGFGLISLLFNSIAPHPTSCQICKPAFTKKKTAMV
jgi:hypothetical protein